MENLIELVFVPLPAITHLSPAMEFAKLLVRRHDRLRITVLVMKTFVMTDSLLKFMRSISDSEPRIKFVDLPEIEPPEIDIECSPTLVKLCVESYVDHVRKALAGIVSTRSESGRVVGLVLDLFCVPMIDVGEEMGIPSYIFLISNAAILNVMLYIAGRELGSAFSDADPDLPVPGFVNPVPVRALLPPLFRVSGHDTFVEIARRFRDTKGIVVNSFAGLEPHAFACFSDGEFQRRNGNPPVYGAGPLVDLDARGHPFTDRTKHDKLIGWLDGQPPASVVFLCFGSMGRFDAPQVKEIAVALERSGCRFLWVILQPPSAAEVLPEGFEKRMEGKGVICEWAPQVEVLAHEAIGGFVSHCGWNSSLESLWNRVPMATWPLDAEQQMNAFLMVKELGGLAVELTLGYRISDNNLVCADEIESAIRRLMNGDGKVRERVNEMGTIARKAIIDDGSSFVSIGRFLDDITGEK